jgi:hypothetical protein
MRQSLARGTFRPRKKVIATMLLAQRGWLPASISWRFDFEHRRDRDVSKNNTRNSKFCEIEGLDENFRPWIAASGEKTSQASRVGAG